MLNRLIVMVSIILIYFTHSNSQVFDWTNQSSGDGSGYKQGESISVDASGNSYVAGFASGKLKVDTLSLNSSNNKILLMKYNPSGICIWAKEIGGNNSDNRGYGISLDKYGNSFVTGFFTGTALFGSVQLKGNNMYSNAFTAKFDPNGECLWAVQNGGSGSCTGNKIYVDASGDSYTTGTFSDQVIWGTNSLYGLGSSFITKINKDGNIIWAKQIPGSIFANNITGDMNGNLYITGCFSGKINLGNFTLNASGSQNFFIGKFDSNGNCLWIKQATGTGSSNGYCISVDPLGNSYVAGYLTETSIFENITLISPGSNDFFVAKYDPNGSCLWIKQAGSTNYSVGYSITSDSNGNVFVTGDFKGSAKLGTFQFSSNQEHTFISKFDPNGNCIWLRQSFGDMGSVGNRGIALNSKGDIYLTGSFSGTASLGNKILPSSPNERNQYIAKIVKPTLKLSSPIGNEIWQTLTSHNITWNTNDDGNLKIEISTDDGNNWMTIAESVPANTGNYTFTVPPFSFSSKCKIKIISLSYDESSSSENTFTITPNTVPNLTLTAPNNYEKWQAEHFQDIIWTKTGDISFVKLEFSTDNGKSWQVISNSVQAELQKYKWQVPLTASEQCLIKVSDVLNPSLWDISDHSFTILQFSLLLPNGGEKLKANNVNNIKWISKLANTYTSIFYSVDNGTNWNLISNYNATNSGIYSWDTPNISSSKCKIKIQDSFDSSIYDISDSSFSIWVPIVSTQTPPLGQISQNFDRTNISLSAFVLVSAPITVTYNWNATPIEGTLPNGVTLVNPYYWQVAASGVSMTNGAISVPISSLPGIVNKTKLVWLKRANSGDPWINLDATIVGDNLVSVISFSSGSEFAVGVTDNANEAPTLSKPSDFEVDQPVTPTLAWNISEGAESYKLQVSTDSLFTKNFVYDSVVTSTSKQLVGLSNLTKYFWRVSAKRPIGLSHYSEVWAFTTIVPAPPIPLLSYPVNNSEDQSVNLNFSWNSATYATSYKFQLATDSLFTSLIANDSSITGASITIPGLLNNKKYFWKVCAKNIGGASAYSQVYRFTTIVATPEKPNLFLPANNSVNQPANITLKWAPIANTTVSRLQIAIDSLFTKLINNDSTLVDTLKQITGLQNNTKYYWRIQGKNIKVPGAWSAVWSFKTIVATPNIPELLSPSNNALNQPLTLNLNWNSVAQAETYRLQVAKDKDFTTLILNDSILISNSKQLSNLDDGIQYFWRVNAKNIGGISSYSEIRSFTTILPAPENTEAIALADKIIRLSWKYKSVNETGFILERKLTSNTNFTIVDTVKAGIITYTDTTLEKGTSYTYRLKAYNQFSESDYGNEAHAKTTTAVEDFKSAVPTEYVLYQNYPNPFNPSTKIKYSLPAESSVRIVIYNAVGEIVRELVNGIQQAGYKEVSFDATDLSSGMYFCSLTANAVDGSKEICTIKKVMLLK